MITILLPISRRDYLRPVFNCLRDLQKPLDAELLIIIDGDKDLELAVDKRLDDLNYSRIQVIKFGDTPAEGINNRRFRISAIHNKAREYVNTEYVLVLEDDTIYPKDTLVRLLQAFAKYEDCAFVEAVQLGRHATPYIGAWHGDNVFHPRTIVSALPGEGLEAIDAGGLYCALINGKLYKEHNFEPYDKLGKNGLSCDVNFGFWLKQEGYECFIDWDIQTDHIGEKGSVNLGNTRPVRVEFHKDFKGNWYGRTVV